MPKRPCRNRLHAYRGPDPLTADGKQRDGYKSAPMVFNPKQSPQPDQQSSIACGTCDNCKNVLSTAWATRCFHEIQYHEHSLFLTLTFNDEALQARGHTQLRRDEVPKFVRALRDKLRKQNRPTKIKYFASGEYGSKTYRPHYHVLLFGFRPNDLQTSVLFNNYRQATGAAPYLQSEFLENVWKKGHICIGEGSYGTAAYIGKYTAKSVGGSGWSAGEMGQWELLRDQLRHLVIGPDGEVRPDATSEHKNVYGSFEREFLIMSRNPGIGMRYLEDNYRQLLRDGYCTVIGAKSKIYRVPLPKAYERWLRENHYWAFIEYQERRAKYARDQMLQSKDNRTDEELRHVESVIYRAHYDKTLLQSGKPLRELEDTPLITR